MLNNWHIGDVRRRLFVPWNSKWNAWVRDFTAWLELRGWFTTEPSKCRDHPEKDEKLGPYK